ncbi:RelA/SpoT family protein [Limnohabitans sp.]|uniref:RelA/SpoT family protein n=1 Tax=Limnohabitans sp. TaxID=1907725 RepID=UPI0038BDD769
MLDSALQGSPDQPDTLMRARAFVVPLFSGASLDTGEDVLNHADAVASILGHIGGSEAMQAACYLVYATEFLNKPEEVIAKAFGDSYAELAMETVNLIRVQRQARTAASDQASAQLQTENVRKMLLAFSRDLRVVLLRLASRLQTLRYHAASKKPLPLGLAHESLHVFAPLANRLGIWQIKWEIEDLSLRFLEPETYHEVAGWLDEKRAEREKYMLELQQQISFAMREQGIEASVQGRPKHIYSIVKKMRGKSLGFERVFDVRALRVIVASVPDCYAVLSWVHTHFSPIVEEFDDYIARPKSNGYQSLHTVVRDQKSRPIEVQIRTRAMHDHAEQGVAAHWAYKEAGARGYAGVSASGAYDAKIAVLRQLLAWERDLASASDDSSVATVTTKTDALSDRIYVLTPDASVVDLPQGATPIDFAYALHTNLGHRCRGARVDGVMVPLHTVLKNGQTVEVTAAKEGGPSRDWLNSDLGFLASPRARSKVRAWFNAQAMQETAGKGREAVEKLLQREGKTAVKLEDLAAQLGFKSAEALFEVVGKDEFSLRNIETLLNPTPAQAAADDYVLLKKARHAEQTSKGGVLVVGIDSLLTQLAKCCKPAPPDVIRGFVTRGKGVSIHRADCSNFRQMALRNGERVIEVDWGKSKQSQAQVYPVDVYIEAFDRQGLLRDISEVFSKEKMNVIGVQTQSIKDLALMTFTVEVSDSRRLQKVLTGVREVSGVKSVRRR